MAAVGVLAMNAAKNGDIFAFFPKTNDAESGEQDEADASSSYQTLAINSALTSNKRRKLTHENVSAQHKEKTQRTLKDILNPAAPARSTSVDSIPTNRHSAIEVEANREFLQEKQCSFEKGHTLETAIRNTKTLENVQHGKASFQKPETQVSADITSGSKHLQTPPKKLLKLKSNGTLASPPSNTVSVPSVPASRRRRRRPGGKAHNVTESLVVKLKYNRNSRTVETTGSRIDRILRGEWRSVLPSQVDSVKDQRTLRKKDSAFGSRVAVKADVATTTQPSPRKASAITPGKLKSQTLTHSEKSDPLADPNFVVGSALLKDRFLTKQAGAREAPWPHTEESHVRGLGKKEREQIDSLGVAVPKVRLNGAKCKSSQIPLSNGESVLHLFASSLTPEVCGTLRPDGFSEPHPMLHLPEKLFISGQEVLEQISHELSVVLPLNSSLNPSKSTAAVPRTHTAIEGLMCDMSSHLTSWDHNEGENHSWVQKYAPVSAAKILQSSNEMSLLRDWLLSQTVTTVESVAINTSNPTKRTKLETKPKRKRARRQDGLDDFLVESDEEYHSMGESASLGEDGNTHELGSMDLAMQEIKQGKKSSNVVLMSGPHGCGKTAAAYAIAQELGFKVFEIGPHERRSGKDVFDKIGNMTSNHLVKHHGEDKQEVAISDPHDDALQNDLATGRQGKMHSFFRTTPALAEATSSVAKKDRILKMVDRGVRKSSKAQKQSLILLEEVDILFKEDKEFWAVVIKLICSSRRPFIMTCNDETMIPSHVLSQYALLRLRAVPPALAIDYLLLIAAREGHLLSRNTVAALYENKRHDLRSTIMELDFWCQMGIGDPRGGLGWLYQRWPPNADLDRLGRRLRVVSRGSIPSLPRHLCACHQHDSDVLEAWQESGVCPPDLLRWDVIPASSWLDPVTGSPNAKQRRQALDAFLTCIDALSTADLCTNMLASEKPDLLCDGPAVTDKFRTHFVEGLHLIQVDEQPQHYSMDKAIAASITQYALKPYTCFLSSGEHGENHSLPGSEGYDWSRKQLGRCDFSCLDLLATDNDSNLVSGTSLQLSIFDGPFLPLVVDVAPYVRQIIRCDLTFSYHQKQLHHILHSNEDNAARTTKRMRATRAARSALEGGDRATTRRERWFMAPLDEESVLATGGTGWWSQDWKGIPSARSASVETSLSSSAEI